MSDFWHMPTTEMMHAICSEDKCMAVVVHDDMALVIKDGGQGNMLYVLAKPNHGCYEILASGKYYSSFTDLKQRQEDTIRHVTSVWVPSIQTRVPGIQTVYAMTNKLF